MGSDSGDGRVDVTMMYVIHDAFRRDLRRLDYGLSQLGNGTAVPGTREAVARTWTEFAYNLHHHHTSEDSWIWPQLRRACPEAEPVLAEMEAEHARVGPLVAACAAAIDTAAADDSTAAQAREALLQVAALAGPLALHLTHEEEDALPYIAGHLAGVWHEFEARQRREAGLRGLLRFLPWALDDATDEHGAWLAAQLPPPIRAVVRSLVRRRGRQLAVLH